MDGPKKIRINISASELKCLSTSLNSSILSQISAPENRLVAVLEILVILWVLSILYSNNQNDIFWQKFCTLILI